MASELPCSALVMKQRMARLGSRGTYLLPIQSVCPRLNMYWPGAVAATDELCGEMVSQPVNNADASSSNRMERLIGLYGGFVDRSASNHRN